MRLKVTMFLALAGLVGAYCLPTADAAFYTEEATIDFEVAFATPPGGSPGPNPPITRFEKGDTGTNGLGRLFTNSYGVNMNGDILVRTVGAAVINGGQRDADPGDPTSVQFATGEGSVDDQMVVVFAIDGLVEDLSSNRAFFTSGQLGVFSPKSPFGFVPEDPVTWVDSLASPTYVATLADPTDIETGFGSGAFDAPASDVNRSTAAGIGLINDGTFLFQETEDPGAGATLTPSPDGTGEFVDVTTNFFTDVLGGDPSLLREGLINKTDQTIDGAVSNSELSDPGAMMMSKLDALNDIAVWAGFTDFGFASGIGTEPGPIPTSLLDLDDFDGDFTAELETDFAPGLLVVPEPTSLATLGIGSLLLGVYYRRKTKAQAV